MEMAALRLTVLAPHRKPGAALKVADFMIDFGAEEQPWEERMKAFFLAHTAGADDGGDNRLSSLDPGDS